MTAPPSKDSQDEEKKEYKRPDFIILDDTQDYLHSFEKESQSAAPDDLLKLKNSKNSFALRVLCLLGLIGALVFGIVALCAMLISLILAAILLFQNRDLNEAFYRAKCICQNAWVISLGLSIAVFSPVLGIGMLLLYFSLKHDSTNSHFLRNMLKKIL